MSDSKASPKQRSSMELMFPDSPEVESAEQRFFAPPKPPSEFSIMMMLPSRAFWKTRGFLYFVAAIIALGLTTALIVPKLAADGPADWVAGTWRYAGPEELDVQHQFESGEMSTYIGGVWSFSAPYRIESAGSASVVVRIGDQQSYLRFDGPDRMAIDDGETSHPYVRIE